MQTARQTVYGLAIESSNPSADDAVANPGRAGGPGVALAEMTVDGEKRAIIGDVLVEPLRRLSGREDDLMPAIDRVCLKAGIDARRIGLVAASIGPGGYTALRVSVTVANILSFTTGALCVPVPSASVVAKRVVHKGRFAVLLASKGATAYATVFAPGWEDATEIPSGRIVSATELDDLAVDLLVADRHLSGGIRQAAEARGIRLELPVFDPRACLELCCRLPGAPAGMLQPLYPREPEAVTLWNARRHS